MKCSRRGCSACGGGRRGEGYMCVGGRGGRVHVCMWGVRGGSVEGGEGCMCVCGGVRGEVWKGGKGESGGKGRSGEGKFKVQIRRCGILTMKITVLLPPHFW